MKSSSIMADSMLKFLQLTHMNRFIFKNIYSHTCSYGCNDENSLGLLNNKILSFIKPVGNLSLLLKICLNVYATTEHFFLFILILKLSMKVRGS